jgi:uncharacterized membrane protein
MPAIGARRWMTTILYIPCIHVNQQHKSMDGQDNRHETLLQRERTCSIIASVSLSIRVHSWFAFMTIAPRLGVLY